MKKTIAYTQYCDDIRQEIDGRPSLMGIYPSRAIVEVNDKKNLSKICVYTEISLPTNFELESVAVVSTWEEEELERVEIPADAINDFNLKRKDAGGKNLKLNLTTAIEIRDLDLGSGGALNTQVIINKESVNSRTLYLKPSQTESSSPEASQD